VLAGGVTSQGTNNSFSLNMQLSADGERDLLVDLDTVGIHQRSAVLQPDA